MNFEKRFLEIQIFLKSHTHLWKKEVLNFYPKSLEHYPTEWLKELEHLTTEELYQIDSQGQYENPGLFRSFQEKTRDLIQVETFKENSNHDLKKKDFLKIKDKKKHEIKIIYQQITELKSKKELKSFLDIGGGVGNLSRIIANYQQLQCFCVEKNKDFINLGLKHLKRYPLSSPSKKLEFIHAEFPGHRSIKTILKKDNLNMGLHTCGALALLHIDAHLESPSSTLFNFGCCYQLLDPQQEVQISKLAKKNPIALTTHALTLATRGHFNLSYEDYLYKQKVKSYRYCLHLFLYHRLSITDFISVGDGKKADYNMDFATYAANKIKNIDPLIKVSHTDLNQFFDDQNIQKILKKMHLCNIIRWQFGRLIELYILLDRCLYLEEKGQMVSMIQYFDPLISPRNLGIISNEKKGETL